jgi:hypothetical protein
MLRTRIAIATAGLSLAVAGVANAAQETIGQGAPAAYWPNTTSTCRIDITMASEGQIVSAVYCLDPHGGVDTNIPLASALWVKTHGSRQSN